MNLRTFLVVTLVTLLIWLWAEVSVIAARGPQSSATAAVSVMPVLVAAPADVQARVVLSPEPAELAGMTVVGPRALVERVQAGTLQLYAVATIEPGQALGSVSSVRVRLTLEPAGLALRWGSPGSDEPLPDAAAPTVLVRLIPR